MSRLSALFPGTITAPVAPPFKAASRLSRFRPPLLGAWFLGILGSEWQRTQERSRIGLISLTKSIVSAAGGGSLSGSTLRSSPRRRDRLISVKTKLTPTAKAFIEVSPKAPYSRAVLCGQGHDGWPNVKVTGTSRTTTVTHPNQCCGSCPVHRRVRRLARL